MYMGEIVRLIILDLWEKELLFVGHRDHNWNTDYRQALYTKGSFYTKYVSEIETDSGVTYRHTKSVLEQMGLDRPTYDDCAIVQYVCKLVSRRGAQLAAAGMFHSVKKQLNYRQILYITLRANKWKLICDRFCLIWYYFQENVSFYLVLR